MVAITIELRNEPDVTVGGMSFAVVPRGVDHRPVADEEAAILLFEASETRNTGNADADPTTTDLERIG